MLAAGLVVAVVLAVRLGPTGRARLHAAARHEDIIRQQASDKNLDPALIAAVIYQESKFRDRTSTPAPRA